MSIINDALKKVQNTLQDRPAAPRPRAIPRPTVSRPTPPRPLYPRTPKISPQRPTITNSVQKNASSAIPDHLVLPALLLMGIPFLILVFLFVGQLSRNFSADRIRAGSEITDGSLTLNGIMTREEKKVALINNKIYEIGESIGEMTLVGISVDFVQILKDGRIRTLKIKK